MHNTGYFKCYFYYLFICLLPFYNCVTHTNSTFHFRNKKTAIPRNFITKGTDIQAARPFVIYEIERISVVNNFYLVVFGVVNRIQKTKAIFFVTYI